MIFPFGVGTNVAAVLPYPRFIMEPPAPPALPLPARIVRACSANSPERLVVVPAIFPPALGRVPPSPPSPAINSPSPEPANTPVRSTLPPRPAAARAPRVGPPRVNTVVTSPPAPATIDPNPGVFTLTVATFPPAPPAPAEPPAGPAPAPPTPDLIKVDAATLLGIPPTSLRTTPEIAASTAEIVPPTPPFPLDVAEPPSPARNEGSIFCPTIERFDNKPPAPPPFSPSPPTPVRRVMTFKVSAPRVALASVSKTLISVTLPPAPPRPRTLAPPLP